MEALCGISRGLYKLLHGFQWILWLNRWLLSLLHAALHTVEFCRNRSFTRIILEGDSLLVVQAINRNGGNWSTMHGNIIADIQEGFLGFRSWKTCHTKRGANSTAHILALSGCRHDVTHTWLRFIPDCIRDVILEIPYLILYSFLPSLTFLFQ
jgi:hypothetical protein